jgi:hypothetical protein
VATELGSHNKPEVRNQMIDPFYEQTEVLAPEDIADGVAYMVTRPATPPSASCGSCPPTRSDRIRCPATTSPSHPTEILVVGLLREKCLQSPWHRGQGQGQAPGGMEVGVEKGGGQAREQLQAALR